MIRRTYAATHIDDACDGVTDDDIDHTITLLEAFLNEPVAWSPAVLFGWLR